jgi:hypothetical protein
MSASFQMEKRSAEPTSRAVHASPALPEREDTRPRNGRLNPKSRSRRTRRIVGISAAIIAVLVAAIIGGIYGARANAYPNYYRINYAPKDTCKSIQQFQLAQPLSSLFADTGATFFDNFDYFTGHDPTHGFVHYVDNEGSVAQNLTHISSTTQNNSLGTGGTAIVRVDTSDKNATVGRRSVRISSKAIYSSGLFIFDVLHSPYGCATWPALWLADLETWPTGGEIDVMETVNVGDTGNHMTLHTTDGCKMGKHRRRKQTGQTLSYATRTNALHCHPTETLRLFRTGTDTLWMIFADRAPLL